MTDSAESRARKALNRLRRAMEKALIDLDALESALASAEGEDFPRRAYAGLRSRIGEVLEFTDDEATRLQEKVLQAGGLEHGRVRRRTG
tara:strand:- start:3630 stop:3896 length:267 start_codon:yes stop_codon:yes gene_type:complete